MAEKVERVSRRGVALMEAVVDSEHRGLSVTKLIQLRNRLRGVISGASRKLAKVEAEISERFPDWKEPEPEE